MHIQENWTRNPSRPNMSDNYHIKRPTEYMGSHRPMSKCPSRLLWYQTSLTNQDGCTVAPVFLTCICVVPVTVPSMSS